MDTKIVIIDAIVVAIVAALFAWTLNMVVPFHRSTPAMTMGADGLIYTVPKDVPRYAQPRNEESLPGADGKKLYVPTYDAWINGVPEWALDAKRFVFDCPPLQRGSYQLTAYAGPKLGVLFYGFEAAGGETQIVIYVNSMISDLRDVMILDGFNQWPGNSDMSDYGNFKRWKRAGILLHKHGKE